MFGCESFLVIFALIFPVFCSNQVPLLLWSSDRSSSLPQVSSLQTVTAPEFKSEFLEKIDKSSPFIIFLQDLLSVEDFSIYGNAYEGKDHNSFENVASSVSLGSSVMMPSVDEAESSLLTLADEKGAAVLTDGAYALPKEENEIIVVHLPATAESDRAKSLAKNDEIIGNVLREVSARYAKYTAVYTGSHSEWADGLEEPEPSYLNRHVLQATADPDTGNETLYPGEMIDTENCTLLYVEDVTVFIVNVNADGSSSAESNYTLKNPDINATLNGECSQKYNWTLSYKDDNFTRLEVSMVFEMDRRHDWYLRDMSVEFELSTGKKGNNPLNVHGIWAPATFSYHCAGDYFKAVLAPSTTVAASLQFAKIQLQPFNVSGTVFGEPWDCVSFFTIGIWMGILVTLIMIVALGIGVTALASIHTNDRFDDPKGKPLIINIVE